MTPDDPEKPKVAPPPVPPGGPPVPPIAPGGPPVPPIAPGGPPVPPVPPGGPPNQQVIFDPGAANLGPIRFDPQTDEAASPPIQEGTFSDRASLQVFFVIADIVLIAILMFFAVTSGTKDDVQEFSRVVMGPLLTILAGAAGYYFGKRDSGPADNNAKT